MKVCREKALTAITAVVGMVALSGCASDSGNSAGDRPVVAFSYAGTDIVLWNEVIDVMKSSLDAQGYELLTDDPQWQAENQVADWDAWIQRGDVKAIMGFPIQPESLVPVTERALTAGIPIVSYATNWEGAVPGLVVDNAHDGRVLAEAACQWIEGNTPSGEKRKVAVMGDGSVELGYQRIDGIEKGLADNCADQVEVFTITDSFTRETGNANTKAQLQAHPDTTVWLTASDDLAKGAYQALVDSGVAEDDPNVYVSAMDATRETVEVVARDGIFRSAFIVTAQEVAEVNVGALLQASRGEEVEPVVLQFVPVTAKNAADYLQ